MHVFTWKTVIELLDEGGREVPTGRTGRVVITDLFSAATPIIRYSGLGDYAVRKESPCSCGRPLPLLLVKDRIPEAQAVSFAQDGGLGQEILCRFDRI
jgi:phenylacetate-coenzyme A ligase PaaK-like adenylate-forming protein